MGIDINRHKSTRQIDLHLPTGWNRCTTEELEAIAAAIIQEQQRVDRYHPFDWSRVKLNIVLSINEITVSGGASKYRYIDISTHRYIDTAPGRDDDKTGAAEWLVKRPQDSEPWSITTGQLVALTERLAWIDDEKSNKTIFQFPYPELTLNVSRRTAWKGGSGSKLSTLNSQLSTLQGPPPLLDGYTWNEYRLLTDWMQAYMRHSNAMAQSKTEDVRRKSAEAAAQAQREFLAILFKPKAGGASKYRYFDISRSRNNDAPGRDNDKIDAAVFTSFDPVKWQVILFWWSSLMSMLAKKFPKVFKSQPVGKGKRRQQQQDTPWDFYNRVTATIQKYIGGLSEQDVNNATYGTILQQLEMMADEAAEMEKLKHKK